MNRRTTEARLEDQWQALRSLIGARIFDADAPSATGYRTAELESKYVLLLDTVKHDRYVGESCMLGLYRAPGSKDRHHAYEGGLVAHLLEMWECWMVLRESILYNRPPAEMLNDSLVLRAIIHHDLNKVHRYRLVNIEGFTVTVGDHPEQVPVPWEVEYAKANEDPLGHALTGTSKSLHHIMNAGIPLDTLLLNALITAEGGYMSDRPKTESVFAKLIYILDELSANVFSRLSNGQFWDSKHGGLREIT